MILIRRSGLAAIGLAALLTLPAVAQRRDQVSELPDELFAPVGTVLTVQIRDFISSNRSSSGDRFLGMLQQPLVIDGWVVARPGQTVIGEVVSASNAGRVKGTSDLAVELTEITLVDGRQVPIRTQIMKNYGPQSHGDDAAAIAGGTALGTLIGAAAGHGKGAAIGAGLGAAAATVGVLSTRGRATEIYPESTVTFRLDAPLAVSTERSSRAFLSVVPADYENALNTRIPPRDGRAEAIAYPPHPSYPPPAYPPDYGRYPYPRYPGSRIGIIPIVIPTIIIDHDDHDRGRRRR
jgi:hypothetical protein